MVVLLAIAIAPACTSADRPAGVVERWLLALNVGAAGRPGEYADTAYLVPFRVETVEGESFGGTATYAHGRILDLGRRPVSRA